MSGKRICINITLILQRFVKSLMPGRHLSSVEKGVVIKKIRALLDQSEEAFARNVGIAPDALRAIESGDIEIVEGILHRVCSLIAIQPKDLESGRLNTLVNKMDVGVLSRIFRDMDRGEMFELIDLYSRIDKERRQKIFHVMKLLQHPLPDNKSVTGL